MSFDKISRKIVDVVRTIADTECQAEVVRQVLCEKSDFEPYTAFQRISRLSTSITSQNLASFLQDNNLNVVQREVFHLIRLFDSNSDGKLSYTEFLAAVLPKKNNELRKEVNKRKPYAVQEDEGLSYQVEHAIARIFEEELEARNHYESLKKELAQIENFNAMSIFKAFDTNDEGWVDFHAVKNFAERANAALSEAQVAAFMHRVDKDGDGLLRYSDFLDIFTPSQVDADEEEDQPQQRGSPLKSPLRSPAKRASRARNDGEKNVSFHGSPKKVQERSPTRAEDTFENVYSPMVSTKANTSIYQTPKKSPQKAFYEVSELSTSQQAQSPKKPALAVHQEINFSPRKNSPMKPKEEFQLVKALNEMLENIRTLENVKNSLALHKDFNTYNAFAIFDTDKQGAVNSRQLEEGLKALNVYASKSDITLIMKRLDSDCDGIIKFTDLCQALVPKTGEFAKLMASRDPYYTSDLENPLDTFCEETMAAFKHFLSSLIDGEALHEAIRQRLVKRKKFNLHDAFKTMDREERGILTAEEFKDMLEENGVFYSQKDVNTLIERFTKAEKGKVSYSDFIREMTPKSAAKY